nr:hypothetical protein Iba_chr04aCG12960 [Ipomoea batatas]
MHFPRINAWGTKLILKTYCSSLIGFTSGDTVSGDSVADSGGYDGDFDEDLGEVWRSAFEVAVVELSIEHNVGPYLDKDSVACIIVALNFSPSGTAVCRNIKIATQPIFSQQY